MRDVRIGLSAVGLWVLLQAGCARQPAQTPQVSAKGEGRALAAPDGARATDPIAWEFRDDRVTAKHACLVDCATEWEMKCKAEVHDAETARDCYLKFDVDPLADVPGPAGKPLQRSHNTLVATASASLRL